MNLCWCRATCHLSQIINCPCLRSSLINCNLILKLVVLPNMFLKSCCFCDALGGLQNIIAALIMFGLDLRYGRDYGHTFIWKHTRNKY